MVKISEIIHTQRCGKFINDTINKPIKKKTSLKF